MYTAPSEQAALDAFAEFSGRWEKRYPSIIRLWSDAWAEMVPFLHFDAEIRKVVCTTNAIEPINARLRRAVNARGHFPNEKTPLANSRRVVPAGSILAPDAGVYKGQKSRGWGPGCRSRRARILAYQRKPSVWRTGCVSEDDVCMRLRDVLGPLFTDEAFAGLFPGGGALPMWTYRDSGELQPTRLAQASRADAPAFVEALPAVAGLRAIWVQQYYHDDSGIVLRDKEVHGRPPGAVAITSPYDLDARYSVKRGAGWNGYKEFHRGIDPGRTADAGLPVGDGP